jgi:hypothetical protein
VPNQAEIAAPTTALTATEPLSWRGSLRIDVAAMATCAAKDDENLIALGIHTSVHFGTVPFVECRRPCSGCRVRLLDTEVVEWLRGNRSA